MESNLHASRRQNLLSAYFTILLKILLFLAIVFVAVKVQAQSGNTPVLTQYSFGLPFAIDGHVQRQATTASSPGDWTTTSALFPTGAIFSPLTGQGSSYPVTLTRHVIDSFSVLDDIFGNGAKADDNPNTQWNWTTGSAGGKEDVNNAMMHVAKDTIGNTWIMLAADRLSQSGTSYIDFEFLQAPLTRNSNGTFTSLASNSTGGRTPNDVLVTMEYVNGGSTPNIYYYKWQLVGSNYDWVGFTPPSGTAYAATNTVSTAVPFGAFGSTTYPAYAFVEAGINVTAFITIGDPCESAGFSSLFIKTKASNSATAVLKDLVGPVQLNFGAGFMASATAGQVTCNGGSTTITAMATGGLPPYTYSLNGGPYQSGNQFTVGAGGPYIVTVKDANLCAKPATAINITQPPALNATASNTSVACFGGSTGSATVVASGGRPPYTYSWNTTPVSTTATITNRPAGTYTATVTDSSGCIATATTTITQPAAALSVAIGSQVNVQCYAAATGSATASGSGGTAPYTYNWNTTPAQTTATATGLVAGTYTVTVTDAAGCVQTANVTITQPPFVFTATATQTNVLCFGNATGTITVTAHSGNPPYTYSWNTTPVQTGMTATGVSAGTYTVTVTDANGCTKTATATITQPATAVSLSISAQANVSCNGGNNGSATVTASGGVGPYTYSWNTIPVKTTSTVTGLSAGTYVATVTDANGCTTTSSVTITQPATLAANIFATTNVLCLGNATGSASVNVVGGTAPYSYSWNTVPAQTTATATGLTAGSYNVTVTDAHGCTQAASATITQPSSAVIAALTGQVNVLCNGATTGSATAIGNGGVPPYSYSWNTTPVQTTATATNITAGTYTVTVTDANGCSNIATTSISQPATPLSLTLVSQTNILCYGDVSATATVSASGGTAPYSYSWNTTPVQTNATAVFLAAGTYIATVTDAHGCVQTISVVITQPSAPLSANISGAVNVLCNGNATGSATVNAAGGTAPYTYSWNTTPAQTATTANGLIAGSYTVTITDANGCMTTASTTITQPGTLNASAASAPTILCYGNTNGSATASASGGNMPYSYAWNTTPVQTTATATNITGGNYVVTVTDANGCIDTAHVTVVQPAQMIPIMSINNLYCVGGTNGSATVNMTGGTAPYTYLWNTTPAQTTATALNLPIGSYNVVITDAHGCTTTSNATLSIPTIPLNAAISGSSPALCFGGASGSASVLASGGATPYNYYWNTTPIQTGATANNLVAGTYDVIVTDGNGCNDTATVSIGQPSTVVSLAINGVTNVSCFSGANGTAAAVGSGGTPPYIYSWNTIPVQATAAVSNLPAGSFTATVTDANGCVTTLPVTISQPPILSASVGSVVHNLCYNASTGSATAIPAGGTAPYSYSWNTTPAQTTATAGSLHAGTYSVTVTDAKGCITTASITINQPTQVTPVVSVNNLFCVGATNGSATVAVSGGTAPYTYSWNTTPVQTTATASNIPVGNYSVLITDANGCATTANASLILAVPPLNASISGSVPVACFGNSTGSASVASTGGTAPYSYSWNTTPTQVNATANGLPAGTYSVIVTDGHGCLDTATLNIAQPSSAVGLGINGVTNVNCFNGANGGAIAVGSGGTAPYSYSWNTIPVQTTAAVSNLTSGSFTATVTDANGCVTTQPVNITQPPVLNTAVASVVNNICFNAAAGSATTVATGGTAPYSYSWNTTPTQTMATANNLPAGTYSVTVTDANGCVTSASATVNQPAQLAPVVSVNNLFCVGAANGSATVNMSGGTAPYAYSWNTTPAQTTATASNLPVGNYSVVITDANGCTANASASLIMPTVPLNANISGATQVACFGMTTGVATVSTTGGGLPYSYSWNTVPTQTTATASGLPAGSYTVIVTDTYGCHDTDVVTITQPASAVNLGVSNIINVSCFNGVNGSAASAATGGTPPYAYSWNTSPIQATTRMYRT